jgi:hypothetical protein
MRCFIGVLNTVPACSMYDANPHSIIFKLVFWSRPHSRYIYIYIKRRNGDVESGPALGGWHVAITRVRHELA